MKKSEREKVFNKYGGKCAYCGCELQKGWHVDHLDPCWRITKWQEAGYVYPSGQLVPKEELRGLVHGDMIEKGITWKEGRYVAVGYTNPEANHIDNYMPACRRCNGRKSTFSIEQFRAEILEQVKGARAYSCNFRMAEDFGLVEVTNKPVIFYFELFNQGEDPERSVARKAK